MILEDPFAVKRQITECCLVQININTSPILMAKSPMKHCVGVLLFCCCVVGSDSSLHVLLDANPVLTAKAKTNSRGRITEIS
jgi:hypothetical protein